MWKIHAWRADSNCEFLFRFVAFIVNNILIRMYHQGIHIRESEFAEVID